MVARFGPDRAMLVASAGSLRIVDASGVLVRDWSIDGVRAADWSLDGRRIAFAVAGDGMLRITEAIDGAWSDPRPVPASGTLGGEDLAFAPDSDWIGYTARDASDRDGFGTHAPLLMATRASDGRVVRLGRAFGSHRDRDFRYWGAPSSLRWAKSAYVHRGRRIFWFAFCQQRDAGLLPRLAGLLHPEITRPARNVWIAAFDPESEADDPSWPAFRLPAQRWSRALHTSVDFALSNARLPCIEDTECASHERCERGFCEEVPE